MIAQSVGLQKTSTRATQQGRGHSGQPTNQSINHDGAGKAEKRRASLTSSWPPILTTMKFHNRVHNKASCRNPAFSRTLLVLMLSGRTSTWILEWSSFIEVKSNITSVSSLVNWEKSSHPCEINNQRSNKLQIKRRKESKERNRTEKFGVLHRWLGHVAPLCTSIEEEPGENFSAVPANFGTVHSLSKLHF